MTVLDFRAAGAPATTMSQPDQAGSWVLSNGKLTATAGNWPVGVALRFDLGKVWFWDAQNAVWNGSSSNSPTTGVGGITLPTITGNLFIGASLYGGSGGDVAIMKTADSEFMLTKPSGFMSADTAAGGSINWDAARKGSNITVSGKTATNNSGSAAWQSVFGDRGIPQSGSVYFEIVPYTTDSSNGFLLGMGNSSALASSYLGSDTNSWGVQSQGSGYNITGAGFGFNSAGTTGSIVRATVGKASGKLFFEVALNGLSNAGAQAAVGLARSTAQLYNSYLGNGGGQTGLSFGFRPGTGQSIYSGAGSNAFGTFTTGTLGVYVDFTNKKAWFWNSNTGLYNNASTATQNPATNTGGLDLSAVPNFGDGSTLWFPALSEAYHDSLTQLTVNFGRSAFVNTSIPSGFTAWDPPALPAGVTVSSSPAGYAKRVDGSLQKFAANTARMTDLGLVVEPSATNVVYNSNTLSDFTQDNLTFTTGVAGAPDSSSTVLRIKPNAGTLQPRTYAYVTTGAYSGNTIASVFVKAVAGVYLHWRLDAGGAKGACINLGTGAVTAGFYDGTNALSSTGLTTTVEAFGSWWRISISGVDPAGGGAIQFLPSFSHSATTSTSAWNGTDTIDTWNWSLTLDAKRTTPIDSPGSQGTRAADSIGFTIPAGVTQLTYTFDDDSTQNVSVSAGAYTIPTNLNRAQIKTIYYAGASSGTIWNNFDSKWGSVNNDTLSGGTGVGATGGGEWIGVAIDFDAKKAWTYVTRASRWNGNSFGDPVAGTGAATWTSSGPYYFHLGEVSWSGNDVVDINFGATPFYNTPPTGFPSWNSRAGTTTLNPSDKSAEITLINGNLTAYKTDQANSWKGVRGTTSIASGKVYFEYRGRQMSAGNNGNFVGVSSASLPLGIPGNSGDGFGFQAGGSWFGSGVTGAGADGTGLSFGWNGARATDGRATGKLYFEVKPTQANNSLSYINFGVADGTWDRSQVGSDTHSLGIRVSDGAVYTNNATTGSALGAISLNQAVGVAVDIDAKKLWFLMPNGKWNNDILTAQNPATGIGGYSLSTLGSIIYPGASFFDWNENERITANFGATPFTNTMPSGFIAWTDGTPVVTTISATASQTTLSPTQVATAATVISFTAAQTTALPARAETAAVLVQAVANQTTPAPAQAANAGQVFSFVGNQITAAPGQVATIASSMIAAAAQVAEAPTQVATAVVYPMVGALANQITLAAFTDATASSPRLEVALKKHKARFVRVKPVQRRPE